MVPKNEALNRFLERNSKKLAQYAEKQLKKSGFVTRIKKSNTTDSIYVMCGKHYSDGNFRTFGKIRISRHKKTGYPAAGWISDDCYDLRPYKLAQSKNRIDWAIKRFEGTA